MRPDKLSVYELFERTRRYVVPLFQRPYVWNKNDQWFPLWEDITGKANQILERQNRRDSIGAHFLGAAVINEMNTYGRQVRAYEIIDGQQRLTTLQILLIALRDFLGRIGFDEYDRDLEQLIENSGTRKFEEEVYKVWPTTADRQMFEVVFAHNSPDELRAYLNKNGLGASRLADCYLFFYDAIDEYIQYGENDDDIDSPRFDYDSEMAHSRIDALMEALKRHLEIVVIELEEDDDPQIIFETLNARGVPLLPSDLIRNFVFLEATRNEEPVEKLYQQYWYRYDNHEDGQAGFWKEEVKQGRLRRPRIDLFFFYYIPLKTGNDIKISHLFNEFRRWWMLNVSSSEANGASVETYLQNLSKYSTIYYDLMNAGLESRLGVFMNRLDTIGTGTVYPVLLFLLGDCQYLADEELEGILTDLESYLVRRMVCSMTTKNYNRIFLSVLRDLKRAETVNRTVFREILLGFEGDAARWPTDDEFHDQWMNNPVYRRLAQMRVRMVLEAIDMQLETTKQEQLYFKDKLSIEHVFPQNPDNRVWPILGEEVRDKIHTFGNLTLLTTALNSSVSNGPFSAKRSEIVRQSKLRLNVYFQDLADQEVWTLDDIDTRGEQLFEVAKAIWPRPDYQAPTRLSPGQERAIESLASIADQNGVGEAFRILIDASLDTRLYPRTSTSSIMYTPPNNKNRCLYTTWVSPRNEGLNVYVATNTFPEFFDVSEQEATQLLGKEGWYAMTVDDAYRFAEALQQLVRA